MGKRHEWTLLQRRHPDGQLTHEKMLNITRHQGNTNQNHNEITPHIPVRMANINNSGNNMLARMQRKRISSASLVAMQAGAATLENSMEVPQKIKNSTTL